MTALTVLDLFSAAAGGWPLGMHRAGFKAIAACESVAWRRELYAVNNPDVRIYDDVRTLTADHLVRDLGRLPGIIVGSPPCQDISPANTKGQGVDGERSGLFFEAIRIAGECRARDPRSARWIALENSHNLRTRGADRVLGALEDLGYACWPLVVRARDFGANHERPRCWVVGHSADADGFGSIGCERRRIGSDLSAANDPEHASRLGHVGGRTRRHGSDGDGAASASASARNAPDADQARQAHGCVVASLRQAEIADHGCGHERGDDVAHADREGQPHVVVDAEMGRSPGVGGAVAEPWADWNGGLAHHLRMDDGLSSWVAGTRVAVGGPRGTSAASLIVEAFGDAVLPQIPEAIGRAILRTEAALAAVYGAAA